MFEAKIYNAIDENELVGTVTIDEEIGQVAAIDAVWDTDMVSDAIVSNLDEIIDMHTAMMADPNANDIVEVKIDLPDTRIICVHVGGEED